MCMQDEATQVMYCACDSGYDGEICEEFVTGNEVYIDMSLCLLSRINVYICSYKDVHIVGGGSPDDPVIQPTRSSYWQLGFRLGLFGL